MIDPWVLEAHAGWLARGGAGEGRLVAAGIDASEQDLSRRDLSRCAIDGATFDRATFDGARFSLARVTRSSFRDAVFGDASLDDAVFVECDFRDADLSALARAGTTAHCRFDRCDLRGTVWIDRDVSRAVFVDCQFDLAAGTPRAAQDVLIARPLLRDTRDATGARTGSAKDVLALWQVGAARPLTDDDKAWLRKSLRGRWRKHEALATRERRPMATGPGTLHDKWSTPPDLRPAPDPGEPIALPEGMRAELTARRARSGVTVYHDAASGFAIGLPSPVFLPPAAHTDATVGLVRTLILNICLLGPAEPGVRAADEVLVRAHEFTGAVPELIDLPGAGVAAAAVAKVRADDQVTEFALVMGGIAAGPGQVVLLMLVHDHDTHVMTQLGVWSAILGSVTFGAPRDGIADLFPWSRWWEPALPLELRASRPDAPVLPAGAADDLAFALISLTALRPPTQAVDAALRGEITRHLTGAGVADATEVNALVTIHDVRGFAWAIAEGAVRGAAVP